MTATTPAGVRRATTDVRVTSLRGTGLVRPDRVATEEPLEIRIGGPGEEPEPVAVTMRTPGHDFELAVGFLHGEGLVKTGEVRAVRYCDVAPDDQQFNVVSVLLERPAVAEAAGRARAFTATSSCGTCGTASIDQVEVACTGVIGAPGMVTADVVASLPNTLREAQRVFGQTGGLHAAGLFTTSGELVVAREDVGRHNAVDKVVGHRLLAGALPATDAVLMVSGRVSFELVQKAALAGIAVLCAVSAPSSLAVEAAARLGVTVVGFVRGGGGNIYTHADRVAATSPG